MRARLAGGAVPHRDEAGMTLVEVMVAMLILTVVFSALASVLTTALHSLHGNENRVKANAVANELLEQLHQIDWADVGFSNSDHGYRDAANIDTGEPCSDLTVEACEATVTFEDNGDPVPDDPRPLPLRDGAGGAGTELIERDGTAYEVRTDITWVDDPSAAGAQDYKRFRITVRWSDLGVARSVTHSATRAPAPTEQDPAAFALRSVDVFPELGYINSPGESDTGKLDEAVEFNDDGTMSVTSQGHVEIEVVTTEPVDDVTVSFINRETDTVTVSLDETDLNDDGEVDGTEWYLPSSTSSSWQYRNGDTTFVVTATRSNTSDEASLTNPVRYVYKTNDIIEIAVDGEAHTVDPDSTAPHAVDDACVQDDGTLAQDLVVDLTTRGMTLDDRVDVTSPDFSLDRVLAAETSTLNGAMFELVIEAGHAFPDPSTTDRVTVDFTAVREFDESTQTRTLALDLLAEADWGGTKCET